MIGTFIHLFFENTAQPLFFCDLYSVSFVCQTDTVLVFLASASEMEPINPAVQIPDLRFKSPPLFGVVIKIEISLHCRSFVTVAATSVYLASRVSGGPRVQRVIPPKLIGLQATPGYRTS